MPDGSLYPGGKGGTYDNGLHVPLVFNQPATIENGIIVEILKNRSELANELGISRERVRQLFIKDDIITRNNKTYFLKK